MVVSWVVARSGGTMPNDSTTATTRQDATAATVGTIDDGGVWMDMPTAAELNGVSLRTFQRWVTAGKVRTRTRTDDGRREAWLPRQTRQPGGDASAHDAKPGTGKAQDAAGCHTTRHGDNDATVTPASAALAVLAERSIIEARQHVESWKAAAERAQDRAERAERRALAGWVAAVVVGPLMALGGVLGVLALEGYQYRPKALDASDGHVGQMAGFDTGESHANDDMTTPAATDQDGSAIMPESWPGVPWPNPDDDAPVILSHSLDDR